MRFPVLALMFAACGSDRGGDGGWTPVHVDPPLAPQRVFDPPVPRPADISSTFGPRWKSSAARYDFHPGIDWFGDDGTPVAAIGDGTVEAVYPEGSPQFPNGGNVLVIRHVLPVPETFHGTPVDHVFAVYLHLTSVAVAAGAPVTRGQVVGAMGHTGDTTFTHLHFEIRVQTMCSLQYQTANPSSSCATGYDPHVHPFLFIAGRDDDAATAAEVMPTTDGDAWTVRYSAPRGDLDLDAIVTDLGDLGFDERRGMDATTLDRLDDFHYDWLTLVPEPFSSSDEALVMQLHFPAQPMFLELRDIDGNGMRFGP
ncbi:MAG: M23 family metallopeptidase [Myxococcales bacterium]|nr:M23 family metallopeptidase [Myxococcales bacterium]